MAKLEHELTMITSSNGIIFRVTGPWWGWGSPVDSPKRASDADLWCFLWSAPELLSKHQDAGDSRKPLHPSWRHCIDKIYPHDDVITWKHFPHIWAFGSSMDTLHKGPVIWSLTFLWCYYEQTIEQALRWPVIWDAMMPMRPVMH